MGIRVVMVAAVLLVACGENGGNNRACTPGESIACVGPSACSGGQACRDDGSGYGPCICAPDASGSPDAMVDAAPDAPIDAAPPDGQVDAALAAGYITFTWQLRMGGAQVLCANGETVITDVGVGR